MDQDDAYQMLFGGEGGGGYDQEDEEQNDIFKVLHEMTPKEDFLVTPRRYGYPRGNAFCSKSRRKYENFDFSSHSLNGPIEVESDILDQWIPSTLEVPKELRYENNEPSINVTYDIPEIVIDNVVCDGSVNCHVDLNHCNKSIKNTSINTKKFPALFVRAPKVNVTLLRIFKRKNFSDWFKDI